MYVCALGVGPSSYFYIRPIYCLNLVILCWRLLVSATLLCKLIQFNVLNVFSIAFSLQLKCILCFFVITWPFSKRLGLSWNDTNIKFKWNQPIPLCPSPSPFFLSPPPPLSFVLSLINLSLSFSPLLSHFIFFLVVGPVYRSIWPMPHPLSWF